MNKLRYIYLVTLLMFVPILCGCNGDTRTYSIGVSQCSTDNWREQINIEMQQEIAFYGDMLLNFKSAESDSEKQISHIEEFIERGVDLIIVIPNEESSLTPVIERAYDKGIDVIIIDTKINSNKYTAFLGADNFNIGELAGQYISTYLDGEGDVVELAGSMSSTVAKERHAGLLSSLSQHQDIKITHSVDASWSEDNAQHITDSLIRINPNIDVIFAHNDQMAYGAYKAARALDLDDQINIIGIDGLSGDGRGLDHVSKGYLDVTFLYPTFGNIVMQRANQILHNRSFPRNTKFETAMIDRVNARVELLKNEQLRVLDSRIKALNSDLIEKNQENNTQRWLLLLAVIVIVVALVVTVVIVKMMLTIRRANEKLLNQKLELEAQRESLIKLSKSLEEATNAKLVFFTNISHDFRTPLTLISDPIKYLLKDGDLSHEQQELLSITSRNVDILLRLIGQILDFRSSENHKLTISKSSCNIADLIKMWSHNFASSVALRNKNISLEVSKGDNFDLLIDKDKIERVYFNLLSNAIKYSTSDNICVKLFSETVKSQRFIYFSLRNHCDVISQDNINNMFDRFYQVEGNTNGSGVGLAISKTYTELHDGSIKAEYFDSQMIVTVALPADVTSDTACCKLDNTTQESEFLSIQQPLQPISSPQNIDDRPLILVVDDNEDIRRYIRILLQSEYNVIDAADGRIGLDVAIEQIPELIISDVMMDNMDGMELCRAIKEEVMTCHIPVLLLTACADEERRIEGYACGADGYIAKPFDQEMLRVRVNNLIKNRRIILEKTSLGEECEKTVATDNLSAIEREFLETFNTYIDKNLINSDLSIEDIGQYMGYSKSQLYRKIKAITSDSPNKILRVKRLERARELLKTSPLTISEVAFEVGFSSPSYFTKSYKEYFGDLPSDNTFR